MRDVKHDARSELSVSGGDWSKNGFARSELLSTDVLDKEPASLHTVPRVHARDLTLEAFIEQFEAPKLPVIIHGLIEDWPAHERWRPEALLRRIPDVRLKVGADDDGYPVRMKLKHYLMYVVHQQHGQIDDSPLYIFDGTFCDSHRADTLGQVWPALRHTPVLALS